MKLTPIGIKELCNMRGHDARLRGTYVGTDERANILVVPNGKNKVISYAAKYWEPE